MSRTYAKRGADKDTLPAIDWVMERQFGSFFDLIQTRYRTPKDVPSRIARDQLPRVT